MGKNIVLTLIVAVGLVASGILLWDCFWWPIRSADLMLLVQQAGVLVMLAGVIYILKKNGNWFVLCFLLGAALMAQINLVSWVYDQRPELTKVQPAETPVKTTVFPKVPSTAPVQNKAPTTPIQNNK